MPVPKIPRNENKMADALRRIKVKPSQLQGVPNLKDTYKLAAEGGLKTVLFAMRNCADDDNIGPFLKKFDSLTESDQKTLPWEAIALSSNLDPRTLSGAIMNALVITSGTLSRITLLTGHPKLMKARIKYGQMASGEKDRNAADLMTGALPSPKPATFINRAFFGAADSLDGKEKDDGGTNLTSDEILDELFPFAEDTQNKLVAIRQRLLPGK